MAAFSTSIYGSRDGTEQRAKRRGKPLLSLAFTVSGFTIGEFAIRSVRGRSELLAPIVVPIWPCYVTLLTMGTTNQARFDVGVNPDKFNVNKFKVGSWAYFVESGKTSVFRQVTSVVPAYESGGEIVYGYIDLQSGNGKSGWAGTSTAVPSYAAGAKVYPCIVGMRKGNEIVFNNETIDQNSEMISVEEL